MSPQHLVSILAEIAAAQARIAGMQAANNANKELGLLREYEARFFFAEAENLSHLAIAARGAK